MQLSASHRFCLSLTGEEPGELQPSELTFVEFADMASTWLRRELESSP